MKEKTADEMFEELGFSKLSEIENEIKTIYRNTKEKHIQFNHLVRRVSFEGSCRWIDMKELQAINKKVEELRMGIEELKQIEINSYIKNDILNLDLSDSTKNRLKKDLRENFLDEDFIHDIKTIVLEGVDYE